MSAHVKVRIPADETGTPPVAVIAGVGDGAAEALYPNIGGLNRSPQMVPAQPQCEIGALSAAQLGIARMITAQEIHQVDLAELYATGKIQGRSSKFERVFFDFPRQEDKIEPMPSLLVMETGPSEYTTQGFQADTMEETVDAFREGTVLRKLGTMTTTLSVVAWLAHKEERRAVRRLIETLFSAERFDDRPGRRVVIPEYYDRLCRYNLNTIGYDDGPDAAQENRWIVEAQVAAEIDVVQLAIRPPLMQSPDTKLGVS